MNDNRFKGKTYEELYKRDWEMIQKDIDESSPFSFEYKHEWEWKGLWIGDAIGEFINPILNPNNYTKQAIKEIEKKQKQLFENENELFSTDFGDFNARYCYIGKKYIIFYDKNKKKLASIENSKVRDLMDENGYIIDR